MLLSHSHRFIFFHVAKTGGLSVKQALQEYAQEPGEFNIKRPPRTVNGAPNRLYHVWEGYLLHASARAARKALPGEVFESYYKFAFVRNPWDWQVSMYHFMLADESHRHHKRVQAMSDFDEYVSWVLATDRPYAKVASKLQKDMLVDDSNRLIVDFVGRHETLAEDFRHICQQLGIDAVLPHLNRTSHRDYRTYYNHRTREMIADHFRDDIEFFGYTFDAYQSRSGHVGHIEPG